MGGGVKMNSCDNAFAQVCTPSQPKMRLCSELTTRSETHVNWASARVNCHHSNTSDSNRINFSCSSRLFLTVPIAFLANEWKNVKESLLEHLKLWLRFVEGTFNGGKVRADSRVTSVRRLGVAAFQFRRDLMRRTFKCVLLALGGKTTFVSNHTAPPSLFLLKRWHMFTSGNVSKWDFRGE